MEKILEAIKTIEKDIKTQEYELENFIGQKNWQKCAKQDAFIMGIKRALFLLMINASS